MGQKRRHALVIVFFLGRDKVAFFQILQSKLECALKLKILAVKCWVNFGIPGWFCNCAFQGDGFVGIIVQRQQLLIRYWHIGARALLIGRTTPDEKAKYVR